MNDQQRKAMFAKKYTVGKIDKPEKHFEGKMFVVKGHGSPVSFPLTEKEANTLRKRLIEHGDRLT